MASFVSKLTGITLSVLGWMLSVTSCALPMWRVSNKVVLWGLWMSCVSRRTGLMRCWFHHSSDQELQAIRTLSVVTIIVGMLGVFINIVIAKCTNCIQNGRVKARWMASSGGLFITAALFQRSSVFWIAHINSRDYGGHSTVKSGVSLYLGWVASVLMLIGGSILCSICRPQGDKPTKYNIHDQSHVEYSTAQSSDNKRDEV